MAEKGGEAINRATTPMKLVEENYEESREQQIQRRKDLEDGQKTKSPFLIGSIDEINKRISSLDRKLQTYTELVVESRASDHTDDLQGLVRPLSTEGRELYQKREREAKEVHRFAGVYTLKAIMQGAFTPGLSERVKNISKISMSPSKTTMKKDSGKPKFVELHQYPGYDPSELTPFPNDVSCTDILSKVAKAQPKLRTKVHYRPEFERLFYSQMSQAVLLDTFWWVFQEKYQPSQQYQMKLFNRIAHNYVKLLTYAKHPQYRDTFLRDYPSLLSQAVYTAFCSTFPDSYRQFNSDFKADMINLIYEWVAGIQPVPGLWQTWNLKKLEPANIKAREEIMTQAKDKKKASVLNFDFLESSNSEYTGSQATIHQLGTSTSSMSNLGQGLRRHAGHRRHSIARQSIAQSSPVFSDAGAIQRVAEAQRLLDMERNARMKKNHKTAKKNSKTSRSVTTDGNKTEGPEILTPIREFDEYDPLGAIASLDAKESKMSTVDGKSYVSLAQPRNLPKKESHPVGRGPEFVRNVFNINGQSPLVAHFLRMKRLEEDAGKVIRVQRTEFGVLPPVGTKTYHDLIQDSFKGVRQLEKDYQMLVDRDVTDSARFVHKQKAALHDHLQRQAALLSKPREVKRLSDLLILELKKDRDSITAGASAAVEAALQSVSVDN